MRIAIGAIEHETNTYADRSSGLTGLHDFRLHRDEQIVSFFSGTRTVFGGMLDAAAELGFTVLPTLSAWAQPSGTISADAYRELRDELCSRIADLLPVDALLLSLHGAGVAEGIDDLEGDLCRTLRDLVGPQLPVVAVFDLHGNVTQAMADVIDLGFGYHLYPHTDMWERGHEAASWAPRLIAREADPVTHVERLPMLLPPATTNFGPAARVNERCAAIETRDKVIDCTLFHGFPFADTPHVGVHVWVTTDGDRELAVRCAREIASFVWDSRDDFLPEVLSPTEAVRKALEIHGGPVVINDTADNAGGGAPADGTHLLRAILDAKVTDACFGFICDPEVATAAHEAGVGATIDVALGGKTDDLHGAPVRVRAYVKAVTDGKFTLREWAPGLRMDHGLMARLVVSGVDVIVGSVRSQTFDPEVFLLHGIDVTRYKIVALKSSQHFRAGFEAVAKEIITADSPGLTTLRPQVFPRARTPRPIWPVDPEATYRA